VVVVFLFVIISKIKLKYLLKYLWREKNSPSLDMFFILPVYHFKTVSNYYEASTTAIDAQAVMCALQNADFSLSAIFTNTLLPAIEGSAIALTISSIASLCLPVAIVSTA
jgi:hypothetical protein